MKNFVKWVGKLISLIISFQTALLIGLNVGMSEAGEGFNEVDHQIQTFYIAGHFILIMLIINMILLFFAIPKIFDWCFNGLIIIFIMIEWWSEPIGWPIYIAVMIACLIHVLTKTKWFNPKMIVTHVKRVQNLMRILITFGSAITLLLLILLVFSLNFQQNLIQIIIHIIVAILFIIQEFSLFKPLSRHHFDNVIGIVNLILILICGIFFNFNNFMYICGFITTILFMINNHFENVK